MCMCDCVCAYVWRPQEVVYLVTSVPYSLEKESPIKPGARLVVSNLFNPSFHPLLLLPGLQTHVWPCLGLGGFELRPSCLLLGEMSFQPLQLAASFEVSKCEVSNFVFQFRFLGLLRLSEILIFRHSQFLGANLLRSGRGCIDSKLGWKKAAM